MAIPSVHTWTLEERLTSTQANVLDGYITRGLDKLGNDTCEGALQFVDGASITFLEGSHLDLLSDAQLTLQSGSFLIGNGVNMTLVVDTGSMTFDSGSFVQIDGTAQIADLTVDNIFFTSPKLFERSFPLRPTWNSGWTIDGEGVLNLTQLSGNQLCFPVKLPHGAIITSVSLFYDGNGSHSGIPSTKPQVALRRRHSSTGVISTIATKNDASLSLSVFDSIHEIKLDTISHTVDAATYAYSIWLLVGEASTNAALGSKISGGKFYGTASAINGAP